RKPRPTATNPCMKTVNSAVLGSVFISMETREKGGTEMLTVTLAGTGSHLLFPHGASIDDAENKAEVLIKDDAGRILAVLQRSDVAIYSTDPEGFKSLESLELEAQ